MQGHGVHPWSQRIPPATGQLSLRTTARAAPPRHNQREPMHNSVQPTYEQINTSLCAKSSSSITKPPLYHYGEVQASQVTFKAQQRLTLSYSRLWFSTHPTGTPASNPHPSSPKPWLDLPSVLSCFLHFRGSWVTLLAKPFYSVFLLFFFFYNTIPMFCTWNNIVMLVNYISTNKQIHRKRDHICGYEKWGWKKEWISGGNQKVQLFGYKINKY